MKPSLHDRHFRTIAPCRYKGQHGVLQRDRDRLEVYRVVLLSLEIVETILDDLLEPSTDAMAVFLAKILK